MFPWSRSPHAQLHGPDVLYLLTDPVFLIFTGALLFWLVGGQLRGRYWSPFGWISERRQIGQLGKEISARPHDLTLRLDHGKLCVKHKQWKQAEASLAPVVERRETSAEAWYFLGRAQLGLKRVDEGLAAIDRALELRPDLLYGEPQMVVGDHYRAAKDWARARTAFEALVETNASSSEGYYKLGLCCRELGDKEAARRALAESVAAHEHVPKYKRRENRPWKWRAKLTRV